MLLPARALADQTLVPVKRNLGRLRVTYEEFLAWVDEDTLAEWVEGEVIMTSLSIAAASAYRQVSQRGDWNLRYGASSASSQDRSRLSCAMAESLTYLSWPRTT